VPLPEKGRPSNPFPGLRPYEAHETHLFFGRDAQVDELVRRLAKHRFLAVVGTSGSGKSSLVRAGLLPALASGFMAEAGSRWRVALFRPGGDPIGSLAGALASAFASLETKPDPEQIETTLRRSSLGLIEAGRQTRLPVEDRTLVLVDQFEELFRFKKAGTASPGEADAFVKLLLEASRQKEVPVYVVLTMRSDFLDDCAEFRDLPDALNDGQYLVPRMTRDERREIIEGPIAVAGASITPRLVQRLLNDAGEDPGPLPVLQHAMMRTFERWRQPGAQESSREPVKPPDSGSADSRERATGPIDLPHYEAAGGLGGALDKHADEAYFALLERDRPLAERAFRCLAEKEASGRETRRPTRLSRLFAVLGAEKDEDQGRVAAVILSFMAPAVAFLTTSDAEIGPDSVIDISHESLIRSWGRLSRWVSAEAESADWYKRVARAAELRRRGEEGYWRDPALSFALARRAAGHWNQAWADQYGPGYEDTVRFLEESHAHQEAERLKAREQEERARRAEAALRRARRNRNVALLAAVVAAAVAGLASWARRESALANSRKQGVEDRSAELSRAIAELDLKDKRIAELLAELEQGHQLLRRLEQQLMPPSPGPSPLATQPPHIDAEPPQGQWTAEALKLREFRRPFGPGSSVAGAKGATGSICCLVRHEAELRQQTRGTGSRRRYVLGLTMIFGSDRGALVLQPGPFTDSKDQKDPNVARVVFAGKDPTVSAAVAELLPNVSFDPRLPEGIEPRVFRGVAENIGPGTEVCLLGRGSGFGCGKVVSADGSEIRITRTSSPGDAGAPVFTRTGDLVGVLVGGGKTSLVVPIQKLLNEASVTLDASGEIAVGVQTPEQRR
jgi:energy-coupling factor transporter ATP-binding protein EcfA2